MAEASNTHKERVRLLLWVLENLSKEPGEEWEAYEREMEEAPEAVRLAHANVLRAWVDMGNLEYGPANTSEAGEIDQRSLNRILAAMHKRKGGTC